MMPKIRIVLDTPLVTIDQGRQLRTATKIWLPWFLKAYGLPAHDVELSVKPGPVGTINIYLTEQHRVDGALGRHGQENGHPAAWISLAANGIMGAYPAAPPIMWPEIRANAIFGVYMPIPGAAPFTTKGLASVLAHEIQELLIDPNPSSALADPKAHPEKWATDPQGRIWLKEVADHAPGYFVLNVPTRFIRGLKTVTVNRLMVIADAALPSFYRLDGVAPFTLAALVAKAGKAVASKPAPIKHPFDWVTGAYGWVQGSSGDGSMSYFARPE